MTLGHFIYVIEKQTWKGACDILSDTYLDVECDVEAYEWFLHDKECVFLKHYRI